MTPEQRAENAAMLRSPDIFRVILVSERVEIADQLEADGVTIATLAAERDAALAEIARLTAALTTLQERMK